MAPEEGLEPSTPRLTAACSTIELLWNSKERVKYKSTAQASTDFATDIVCNRCKIKMVSNCPSTYESMLRTCTVLHCLRFYDMENFVRVRLPWLKTFLRLRNESPSHDNRNRVFQALDPKEFGECMAQWTQSKRTVPGGEGVALDGKAIRRVHSIKAKTPASLSAVGDPRRPAAGPAQGQGQEQRNHHPAGVWA